MNRNRKLVLGVVLGAAMVVTAGGIAYGAMPSGTDNTVTACVLKAGGATRIIDTDAAQVCQSTETTVTWGGGMRYIGKWSKIGTRPRVNGYPDIRKGDVIYYDGLPNAFGCTSPKGSYVSVVGSYAYPCMEFPQNWAPLALDGTTGPAGPAGRAAAADVHWANFDAQGKLIDSSEPLAALYPSSSYTIMQFSNVDPTKCALSATVSDYTKAGGLTAFAQNYYGYVLLGAKNMSNGFVGAPISVVANCGKASTP